MKASFIVALLLPLGACATPDSEGRPSQAKPDTCNPAPGQNYLGQRASPQTGSAILVATGASRLRWLPPRSVVTMEYAYGRVTVSYDDDYRITRVTCG